jgi:acyl carrier protein
MDPTTQTVRAFLLEQFLPGEDPAQLTDSTPLFSSGLLDSIASLQLVSFLETQFGISIQAHEVVAENLNTLTAIAQFVRSKQA